MKNGYTAKDVQGVLSDFKQDYLNATGTEKIQLKNALIMAYKATGMKETDANDRINKWKETKKKTN